MPKRAVFLFLLTIAMGLGVTTVQADDAKIAEGKKAIDAWIAIVDAGEYAKSYDEVAQAFKNVVTQDQWVAALTQSRGQLGAVQTRNLTGERYTTQLPNAPAGEYVVTQHETVFANAPGQIMLELTSVMLEDDGVWRVAGYFVQPKPAAQ